MQAIVTTIVNLWRFLDTVRVKFWAVAIAILIMATKGVQLIGYMTIKVLQKMADVVANIGEIQGVEGGFSAPCGTGLQEYLAIANTLFPLDELCKMLAALLVFVWIPLGLYRFVKSWIPAMGSGS